jgi:hypothetical protein
LAAGLLSLVPWANGVAEAELVDRIVAIVDRDVVLLSEAERAMWIVEASTDDEASLSDVVERLIETTLIEREVARFSGEPVPDEAVEAQLERVRSSFASERAFEAMLVDRGMSEDDLRADLRRQLTVNRYLERRFRALTYVTDNDIDDYFSAEILPRLTEKRAPTLEEVDQIRRILEEKRFNERVDRWIDELKRRSRIRRYVW